MCNLTIFLSTQYGMPVTVERLGATVLSRDFDLDGYGDLNGVQFQVNRCFTPWRAATAT